MATQSINDYHPANHIGSISVGGLSYYQDKTYMAQFVCDS